MSVVDYIADHITKTGEIPYESISSNYDVVIGEGYEMVGKSTILEDIRKNISGITYRPNYEIVEFDDELGRSRRYMPGLCALDFFTQTKGEGNTLMLDRGICSWIVYGKHYHNQTPEVELKDVLNACSILFNNLRVLVIYKYHKSEEDARFIHTKSTESREVLDEYDEVDFDSYWKKYLEFDQLFKDSFKHVKCDILAIDSLNTVANNAKSI